MMVAGRCSPPCRDMCSPRYLSWPSVHCLYRFLPTVGYQDLYVMTCGTVQQGNVSFRESFSPWSTITVLPGGRPCPPAADASRLSAHRTAVILLQVHLRATVSSDNLHLPSCSRAIMTSSATRSRCPAAPPDLTQWPATGDPVPEH